MSRGYLCIWFTTKGELRWPIFDQHLLWDTHCSFDHWLHISWCDTIRRSTLVVVNIYYNFWINKSDHGRNRLTYWLTTLYCQVKQMPKRRAVVLFNGNSFPSCFRKKGSLMIYPTSFVLPHLLNKIWGKKAYVKWALLVIHETADGHSIFDWIILFLCRPVNQVAAKP